MVRIGVRIPGNETPMQDSHPIGHHIRTKRQSGSASQLHAPSCGLDYDLRFPSTTQVRRGAGVAENCEKHFSPYLCAFATSASLRTCCDGTLPP